MAETAHEPPPDRRSAAGPVASPPPRSSAPSAGASTLTLPSGDSGFQLTTLLRDSAVLLAATTALLYVTSHIYGAQYLAIYGIGHGFHGIGLAHLAMISFVAYLGLVVLTWLIYRVLGTSRTRLFAGGMAALLAVILARPLIVMAYQATDPRDLVDGAVLVGLASWGACLLIHVRIAPRARRSRQCLMELEAARAEGERVRAELAARVLEIDARIADLEGATEASVIAGGARGGSGLEQLRELRRCLLERRADVLGAYDHDPRAARAVGQTRRVHRWYKLGLWIVSGFMAVVFALPGIATLDAIAAARQQGYASPSSPAQDAGAPALRIPVYWVQDRVVYLTTGRGECNVHIQLESELARRRCPSLVDAVIDR